MKYHSETRWQAFSYKVTSQHMVEGDFPSVHMQECVCVCVRVHLRFFMPTLFTHVNTQKPHGRPLRAAAAVEYVIQMVCDYLCFCIGAIICVFTCVIISACRNKRH